MIDFSKPYYEEYYSKVSEIKDLIISENFFSEKNMKISWNINEENGTVLYAFKKLPTKGSKVPLNDYTSDFIEKFFMNDDRILAFSKITIPAGEYVGDHKDNCYWQREFFRAHIPLMDTEAVFYYGDEEINWKKGQLYFFDVRNVNHSAKNDSDKDFEFIAIDICIEDA